ncbi:uncharacterized protein TNCV_4065201 [Trichonephila clavipes]|uniref:Uncharacterized protein n=1 Tax=Trichonephila clavipes TaxID=2585209 RepID=A0A8X6W9C5_TRICX|nr:uncharacterized protein TNCV_4065201 [Trichonephila clavipes]
MVASLFLPTDLGREENVEVGQSRSDAFQWRPTRFDFPNSEIRGAAGLRVMPEVYFSESENVDDFIEGARDWYEIFGSNLVQNTGTDFAQLKAAVTKNLPVVRNRKDLEIQFYSAQHSRGQEPTDIIYDFLRSTKRSDLERYSCKEMRCSRSSDNVGRRSWDERRMSNDNSRRINWRDAEVIHRPSDRRSNYRGNYEKGPQWS